MGVEENKALLRRFYTEVFEKGNLAFIDESTAPDFVDHETLPGQPEGREGVKAIVTQVRTAFPDLSVEVNEIIGEGDKVAAVSMMRGTHRGEFMGAPATGNAISMEVVDLIRFADGKAVEHWGQTDLAGLLAQIGVLELPG